MHVLVNAAISVDGKLSTRRREQLRISGEGDFARVDRLRAEHDAVMVGVGTVLADDPSLVRYDESHRRAVRGAEASPPARIVADSRARTPPDAAILAGSPRTYLLVSDGAPSERLEALREAGATVVKAGAERVVLPAALDHLEATGIHRLLVEGGGELIFSLFDADQVDALSVFVGPLVVGGADAPTLADGEGFVADFPELTLTSVERVDEGVVLEWDVEDRLSP